MEILLVAALAFLLCWLVDKGFARLFRGKAQHKSGRSVRLSKYQGLFGIILIVLGISCLFASEMGGLLLLVGGIVVLAVGIGLAVNYLSFGIFYDDSEFLISKFGKKSKAYSYRDITSQQLFVNGSQIIIELFFKDGDSLQLYSTMTDVYAFLDHAFARWLEQTGRSMEDCPFHDPANSCWFPKTEVL